MTVYFIADIKVTDPEAYQTYAEAIPAIVRRYGGRHLVRGGRVKQLEGGWDAQRVIVMAFPTSAHAKAFALSEEYVPLAKIRYKAGEARVIAVDGIEDPELDLALFGPPSAPRG